MDIQIKTADKKGIRVNKYIIYLFGFLLLAAALVGTWLSMGDKQKWYQVETRKAAATSLGMGEFITSGQRVLTSNEMATVKYISKGPGERLEPGETVMTLESSVLSNELESAKIRLRRSEIEQKEALLTFEQSLNELALELRKSEISLKMATVELYAHKSLLEKNVVSELQYAKIQADYDQRQSELDAVVKKREHIQKFQVQRGQMMEELVSLERLNVARVQERLNNLVLQTSESVMVKEILVAIGDSVQSGTRLAVIGRENPDGVRLRFPQQDFSQLQVGTALLMNSNGEDFMATVNRVMPDLQDGYLVVETGAEGIPANARTEMSVQGKVNTAEASTVVAIYEPEYSLIPGQRVEIFLRRNGNISTVILTDVVRQGGWLVFPSRLKDGDEVVFKLVH